MGTNQPLPANWKGWVERSRSPQTPGFSLGQGLDGDKSAHCAEPQGICRAAYRANGTTEPGGRPCSFSDGMSDLTQPPPKALTNVMPASMRRR